MSSRVPRRDKDDLRGSGQPSLHIGRKLPPGKCVKGFLNGRFLIKAAREHLDLPAQSGLHASPFSGERRLPHLLEMRDDQGMQGWRVIEQCMDLGLERGVKGSINLNVLDTGQIGLHVTE